MHNRRVPDDASQEAAARAFGYGLAAAIVSSVTELLVTYVVGRGAPADAPILVQPGAFALGALLRVPLTMGIVGALTIALPGEAKLGGRRHALVASFALVLAVEVASYRWLGETGDLLRLGSTFAPARSLLGVRGVQVVALGILGAFATFQLGRRLEMSFAPRYSLPGRMLADALTLGTLSLLALSSAIAGPTALAAGATPAPFALLTRSPRRAATADARRHASDEPVVPPTDEEGGVPADVRALLYHYLAPDDVPALTDARRPFCRSAAPTRAAAPQSIVLLVLRGVHASEIEGPTPALPGIAALAAEGVSFTNAFAGADEPTQGMVQLLAGIHPPAPTRYDEAGIPPRLPSLPSALGAVGLATRYVSTFDLSPGRERTLVGGLGFEKVVEPSFEEEAARGAEAGSDAATLDAMRATLRELGATPSFVAAPMGDLRAAGAAPSAEDRIRFDGAVTTFVRELRASSPATVVVLAGDAARRPSSGDPDFRVPLVFLGLPSEIETMARARRDALVALHDVPPILLGLEGQGPVGCFHGRDLLSRRAVPPEDRRLVALAGPDQSTIFVFEERLRWRAEAGSVGAVMQLHDRVGDPGLTHDLYAEDDVASGSTRDFIRAFLATSRYLGREDRYVPGETSFVATPLPPVTETTPIVPVGTIGEARGEGYYLLPVTFDAAGEPGVAGIPLAAVLRTLTPRSRGTVVLDLEVPATAGPYGSVAAARCLARDVRSANLADRVIVLPRDPLMATSLAHRSPIRVFLRLPNPAPEMVDTAKTLGVDGVVIPPVAANAAISRARTLGLTVTLEAPPTEQVPIAPTTEAADFAIVRRD